MVIPLPLSRCSCTAAGHDYSAVWWPVVIDDDGFFESTLVLYLHVQAAFAMCQSDLKMLVLLSMLAMSKSPEQCFTQKQLLMSLLRL